MIGWLGKINWDRVDALWASMSRPYLNYTLGTSIALACLHKDTAPIAIPSAAALLGGNVAARTVEKVTNMKQTTIVATTNTDATKQQPESQ